MKTEAPLLPGFPSELIFSGFDSEYRLQLHESIFNLIWFGEGRWSWDDIYHMPLFLRKYWIKRVTSILEAQQSSANNMQQKTKSNKNKFTTK